MMTNDSPDLHALTSYIMFRKYLVFSKDDRNISDSNENYRRYNFRVFANSSENFRKYQISGKFATLIVCNKSQ